MAKNNIKGLTVEIGGDTQKLTDALKEVNNEGYTLQSDLKAVNNLLKLDPGNVSALAEKQRILAEAVENSRNKLDQLHDAQEQIDRQYASGRIDRGAYLAFQNEVAATESQLRSYESQLEECSGSNRDMENTSEEAGNAVEDAGEKAENSKKGWETLGTVLGTVAVAAGTALVAVGTAAGTVVEKLAECSVQGAAYADDMLTLSAQTGVSTDALQGYAYAADIVDVSLETMTASMAKNVKSMSNAAQGSAKYADAYKQLEVSVTNADGTLRDSEQVYWDTIDALGKIEDETQRDTLAMQIFGKSAQELNPLISQGSAGIQELSESAKDAGAVLSGDILNDFGAFQDQLDLLKSNSSATSNALGTVLLPALTELSTEGNSLLTEFTNALLDTNGDLGKVGGVVGDMLGKVVDKITEMLPEFVNMGISLVGSLGQGLLNNIPKIVQSAQKIVSQLANGLLQALPQIAAGAVQIIASVAQGIAQSLPTLIPSIVGVIMQIVQTLVENIPLLVDCALQLVTGLAQGLLAAIPVLIEALPQLIQSLVNGLLSSITMIIECGVQLLTALITELPTIIQTIVEALPQIISSIITALTENLPLLIQAGIDLFTALITNMPIIIQTIIEALPQIIDSVITALQENFPLLMDCGKQMFVTLVGNMPDILKGIGDGLLTIWTSIKDFWSGCFDKMGDIGLNLITGIWEGISNAKDWLVEKISGFFDGIVDYIKEFFGIHSPSTLFRDEVGSFLAQGIGVGFSDEMQNVSKEMTDAVPTDFDVGMNVNAKGKSFSTASGAESAGSSLTINQYMTSPKALDAYEIHKATQSAAANIANSGR